MKTAWSASLPVRAWLYLAAHIPGWYENSLLGKLSAFFARSWPHSGAKRAWDGFLAQNPGA